MQSDPSNRARLSRACKQPAALTASSTDAFQPAAPLQPTSSIPDYRRAARLGIAALGRQPTALSAKAPVHGFGADPTSVADALSCPDADKWQAALDSEIDSLLSHNSWEICQLPADRKAVGSRFIFTRKRDGRYKARLVAQGFSQLQGVDYGETYAPVSRYATFRALMAVAAAENLTMAQLDVKTAFLYGEIEEEVYMKLPPGYEHLGPPGSVCRIVKAVYGLKQAPRQWNSVLVAYLTGEGFIQSTADPSLFVKRTSHGLVYIIVYVDDCIIAGHSPDEVEKAVNSFKRRFDAHSLGAPADYCGILIERDTEEGTITLHQSGYVLQLLAAWDADGGVPKSCPQPSIPLVKEGEPLSGELLTAYPSLVGSLMHLANCTRPDIAQPVSRLARYLKAPTIQHWGAAQHLLSYLAGTVNQGIRYGKEKGLLGFCDSDFAGDLDTRRSTSGFLFTLHGGAICWQSKLQSTVSQSTMEAEYQSAGLAGREGLWLRQLMETFSYGSGTVTIQCDNDAALCLLHNPMSTRLSKHIDVIHHFARERVLARELEYVRVDTADNVSDCLTKFVPQDKLALCKKGMGIV
jgi:Reverse transcriptase (RNA-dependent DNA polymerase)